MPTLEDHFVAELARSGILERLKPWGELFVQVLKMPEGMFLMARAIAERAEENFPSRAYGPYLEARGFAPFLARGLGSLTISLGTREADEAKRVAPVVEAIRFLSRSDRQKTRDPVEGQVGARREQRDIDSRRVLPQRGPSRGRVPKIVADRDRWRNDCPRAYCNDCRRGCSLGAPCARAEDNHRIGGARTIP